MEVGQLRREAILAVDIGGGTQDILIWELGRTMENCVQLVLPARTVIVSEQVKEATAAGKPVYLYGNMMGGGACNAAVTGHLKAGLPVYATPLAAKTIFNDLDRVAGIGVRIAEGDPPRDAVPVLMQDLDLESLGSAVGLFGVELPARKVIAVQDHGENPGESSRLFRFRQWQRFVESGGDIRGLIYREVPPYLTRMLAVQRDAPGAWLADTGAAAIWGALEDPQVSKRKDEGIILVNCGNEHTIGVLFQDQRVWGLFEHHTGMMTPEKLDDYVARLRDGKLSNQEVFQDGGHGCYISPGFLAGDGFTFMVATGPRRSLAGQYRYYAASPHGNMMLAGCYGLVAAWRAIE